MEQDKKISQLLGLSQEDIAMLVGVSRGQWSMYEIGKRDLPPTAQLKLIQLLAFINQPKTENASSFVDLITENAKIKKVFDNLQLINKHQQLLTERKIQAIEKKQEASITALRLILFLETNDSTIATEQKAL